MKTTARAVLLNRNGQCLFVQHNEWNPADRGKWATVGGRVEEGESHEDCLRRELTEEFGKSVANRIKFGPKVFENFRQDRIDHFYVAWLDGEDVKIEAVDEILAHKWCSQTEAEQLKFYFGFEADLVSRALAEVRQH